MNEVERINKSVLIADSIKSTRRWSLAQQDNPVLCSYCKSPLFYLEIVWGIIEEEKREFKVMGKEREPQFWIREVGLNLYCAECGHFNDDYFKYFYPEDRLVCLWNDEELDLADIEEIKHCLEQFNRKGDFTPNYNSVEVVFLKKKLLEYEKRNYPKNKKKLKI